MENFRLFLIKWSTPTSTMLRAVCIAAVVVWLLCRVLCDTLQWLANDTDVNTPSRPVNPAPPINVPSVCYNGAIIGIFHDLYLLCRTFDHLRPELSDFARNPRIRTAVEAFTCGTNLRPFKVSEEIRSDFTGLLRNVGLSPRVLSESDVGDAQSASHRISKLISDHIAPGHNYYALLVDHYYYSNHQAVVADATQLAASRWSGDDPELAESKLFVIDTDLLGSRFPGLGGTVPDDAYGQVDDSIVIALVALPCSLEFN